jgi:hypothetical protein
VENTLYYKFYQKFYQKFLGRRGWSWRSRNYSGIGGVNRSCHYIQVSTDQPGTEYFRENYQREFGNLGACKGEIVAFLSLIFILILSFVAALLESASIQVAKNYRRVDMNRAIECVFAEYQKELLEEYDIFALDATYETGQYSEQNLTERLEYYGVSNTSQQVKRIQFLTDQNGASFYDQVTAYMENQYGVDVVRSFLGTTSVWQRQEEQSQTYVEEEETQEQNLEDLLSSETEELSSEDNPIEHVTQLKQSPVLTLVLNGDVAVSEKQVDAASLLVNRDRNEGYGDFSDVSASSGTLSNLLFGEYLLGHFSSFTGTEEENRGVLDYELEYILAGKSSDKENLEVVVKKLMLLRFVSDYAYLKTDSAKCAEAEALAGTLCTLLVSPGITDAVAQVILLMWAYGESIMDLRSLLEGRKIPLAKTKETWQLQLTGLLKLGTAEEESTGIDCEDGMTYEEYLRMLLFLNKKETLALRALTVIEQNLRTIYGQSYFQADLCVSRLEMSSISLLRRNIQYEYTTYYGYK